MESWEKCGSMRVGRCYHGMAAVGGRLFVAGGQTDGIVPEIESDSPESLLKHAMFGSDAVEEPETDVQTMLDSCEVCTAS